MSANDDPTTEPAHRSDGVPYDLRTLRALRRIMRAVDLHSRKLKSEVGLTTPPLQDKLAAALASLPELVRATIALSLERVVDLMEARDLDAAPILEAAPLDSSVPTGFGSSDPD